MTGCQTCALPISVWSLVGRHRRRTGRLTRTAVPGPQRKRGVQRSTGPRAVLPTSGLAGGSTLTRLRMSVRVPTHFRLADRASRLGGSPADPGVGMVLLIYGSAKALASPHHPACPPRCGALGARSFTLQELCQLTAGFPTRLPGALHCVHLADLHIVLLHLASPSVGPRDVRGG